MAACGEVPEAAAFPGCSVHHPSARGIWASQRGDEGGVSWAVAKGGGILFWEPAWASQGLRHRGSGSSQTERSDREHPACVSPTWGQEQAQCQSTGAAVSSHFCAQGRWGGEEGWKLEQESTSRADVPPPWGLLGT